MQNEIQDEKDAEVLMNIYFRILNEINITRCFGKAYIMNSTTKVPSLHMSQWES